MSERIRHVLQQLLQSSDVCLLERNALGGHVFLLHALHRSYGIKSSPVESNAHEHDGDLAARIYKQLVPSVASRILTTCTDWRLTTKTADGSTPSLSKLLGPTTNRWWQSALR